MRSYAQCGEDVIIDYVLKLRGVDRPSYFDVGAFHPMYLSNTALFYTRGCRGVNVEPNPDQYVLFRSERAEDVNLNIGIGAHDEVMTFYRMEDATLSTFSKKEADALQLHGKMVQASLPLRTRPLDAVVEQYCGGQFPDFLTIDAEGMEIEILSTIKFERMWPKVICVETAEYSPTGAGAKRKELMSFIESKGYMAYADTNLNTIYVKKQFWLSA